MNATPIQKFLQTLYVKNGEEGRQNGNGWSARCPAHEDARPSLSISEDDDGRALIFCHAGCTVESICDAVELRVADLINGYLSTATKPRQTRGNRQLCRQGNDKPAKKTYETANAAVAALERKHGKVKALWAYHDAQGNPVGVIVRWDKSSGKNIRPVARRGD